MNIGPFESVNLTTEQVIKATRIKNYAWDLWTALEDAQADPRMTALAKTKLEECVMWATKAISRQP